MRTTREKLERKLEKRQEWAEKARAKGAAEFAAADKAVEGIPFGQPIMVGHHSEKTHRRAIERAQGHSDNAVEAYRNAEYHEDRARGLERRLETTIFSDDEDAVERLEERIGTRRDLQEKYRTINKIIRTKHLTDEEKRQQISATGIISAERAAEMVAAGHGIPAYAMTNNNGEIRRLEQRVAEIKRRAARQAEAEQAGGVAVKIIGDYVAVTFAEKPDYSIIRALKDTGFYFSGGTWRGLKSCLPECVRDLLPAETAAEIAAAGMEQQA